jgi:hypothetical protein
MGKPLALSRAVLLRGSGALKTASADGKMQGDIGV